MAICRVNKPRMYWGVCFLSAILPYTMANSARASDEETVASIIESWTRQGKAIDTLRVQYDGDSLYAKGQLTNNPLLPPDKKGQIYPPEDKWLPLNSSLLLNIKNKQCRMTLSDERFNLNNLSFYPYRSIQVYNNFVTMSHDPRQENTSAGFSPGTLDPDVEVIPSKMGGLRFGLGDLPILIYCGFVPEYHFSNKDMLETGRFKYGGFTSAKTRADVNGTACMVLQRQMNRGPSGNFTLEFWVDQKNDNHIRRLRIHFNNSLVSKGAIAPFPEIMRHL